jgi:hypothetical protein
MSSTGIDPRGPRFAAAITSAVLALVVVLSSTAPAVAGVLLAAQALVFALGSRGRSPYAAVFRVAVRPRLGPPAELEDPRPPQFAQLVGLAFTAGGVLAFALGATAAALVLTSLALVAALLNASIGLCLGCEAYLLFRRFFPTHRGVTA